MNTPAETIVGHIVTDCRPADTLAGNLQYIAELVAQLKTIICESTGADRAQVTLHAHNVPAERWHGFPAPMVAMPSTSRPTDVAKWVGGTLGMFTLWCAHRQDCPDLLAAQEAWDSAHSPKGPAAA